MGLIRMLKDLVMKLLGMKSDPAALPSAPAPHVPSYAAPEPEPAPAFDLAGFDPERNEDAYWEAILYIESEGMIAPNVTIGAADRERTMRAHGIRDHEHWDVVKSSCYRVLVRKYGSEEIVNQRMLNHRMGMTQKLMQAAASKAAKSGELNPAFGVSLELWAAFNAALAQGANLADILKGQGIDQARWDKARAEWEARMSRDTTFVIAQIYGAAFQNASQGKYSAHAKEANAARVENRDLRMPPPMSLEEFWTILFEQAYAAKQGKDPNAALKSMGIPDLEAQVEELVATFAAAEGPPGRDGMRVDVVELAPDRVRTAPSLTSAGLSPRLARVKAIVEAVRAHATWEVSTRTLDQVRTYLADAG